jgi:hypothetical protein
MTGRRWLTMSEVHAKFADRGRKEFEEEVLQPMHQFAESTPRKLRSLAICPRCNADAVWRRVGYDRPWCMACGEVLP